jgi:hypothetical protein
MSKLVTLREIRVTKTLRTQKFSYTNKNLFNKSYFLIHGAEKQFQISQATHSSAIYCNKALIFRTKVCYSHSGGLKTGLATISVFIS